MIHCPPIADECNIAYQWAEAQIDAQDMQRVEHDTFVLGEYNGRRYTHTVIDGTNIIVIESIAPVPVHGAVTDDVYGMDFLIGGPVDDNEGGDATDNQGD